MIKGGDVENAIVYVNNILEDKELQQIATFSIVTILKLKTQEY